ncbi:MAG: NAD-dependent epimerase/dehydratase family protein [Pseudohongiellaceae bacterium]
MQDRKKTVLVTGATGFVGQHLCRELSDLGFSVRTLLHTAKQSEIFPSELELTHFFGDLLDVASLETACANTDILVHLGGVAHVDNLSEKILQEINVEGTRNILQVAIRNNVSRIILMSSSLASDAEKEKRKITEYGRSKIAAEELVRTAHQQGDIEGVVLRPVNVYGTGMKGNIASMISLIGKGQLPPLPKVETQISLVGIDDLIQAVVLAINKSEAVGRTYYVTDGIRYSIAEIEEAIYRAWGRKIPAWKMPHMLLYCAAGLAGLLTRFFMLIGFKRRLAGGISGRTYRNLVTDNLFSNNQICGELGYKPICNFYEALPHIIESFDRQAWLKERD